MFKNSNRSYYDVLGIQNNSNNQQIKQAYKELALKYHPDKTSEQIDVAREKFTMLKMAYQTLSDEDRRLIYDLQEKNKNYINQIPILNHKISDALLQIIQQDQSSHEQQDFLDGSDISKDQDYILDQRLKKINHQLGPQMANTIRLFSKHMMDIFDDSDDSYEIFFKKKIQKGRKTKKEIFIKQECILKQQFMDQQNYVQNLIKQKKNIFLIQKKPIKKTLKII